jgi:hypothetical protein
MQAIGWYPVADVRHGGYGGGVIEYGPRGADGLPDERLYRESFPAFCRIQSRCHGADFFRRTGRYLFDLGLREEVLS